MSAALSRCDVAVIGLGPAGACAAEAAARAGARVIAIDRRLRPGLPVQCAELVPQGLALALGALDGATRQPIRQMSTCIENDPSVDSTGFCGWMIDRAAFDRLAVEAACASGAECRFGVACRAVEAGGQIRLNDGSILDAAAIVAADGPRSTMGHAIGLSNERLIQTRQIAVPLTRASEVSEIYLTQGLPGGYGWLFPSQSRANLGVGATRTDAHGLKCQLDALRLRLLRAGPIGAEILGVTGGAIPAGGIVGPIGKVGAVPVLLAGDAAGLANPVTGAGIAAAVMSGKLAGKAAAALASGDADAAADYAEEIFDLFGPSLDRALARAEERRGADCSAPDWRRSWVAFPEYWQG